MITYLSGAMTPDVVSSHRHDLGIMIQPRMGNAVGALDGRWFAVDNDCFAQGDRFEPEVWLRFLDKLRQYRTTALFATAPDVVGDADATLLRSVPWFKSIKDRQYPVAFVTQDGCNTSLIPWQDIDWLFVGGSTAWKLSDESWGLVREAKDKGKRVHVGRVNSLKRLRLCADHGADSADGTFLKYGPKVNWPRLVNWLDTLNGKS